MDAGTKDEVGAPSPLAATGSPAPSPVSVNGAPGAGAPGGRILWIGAMVALALASVGGLVWLAVAAYGPLLGSGAASDSVSKGIAARAAKDYPTFAVDSVDSMSATSSVASVDREIRFYVTMRSRRVEGFTFRTLYSASERDRASVARYVDYDHFFSSAGTTDGSMTASFERTWVLVHPGSLCVSVSDMTVAPGGSTISYEVGYFPNTSSPAETAYMSYDPSSATWSLASGGDDAAAQAPKAAYATRADGSLVDTAAAVSEAYPGFEPFAPYRESTGSWSLLVRSSRYPKVILAVDPSYLDVVTTAYDDERQLVSTGARSASFLKAWGAAHGGTAITFAGNDPDYRGPDLVVDLMYASAPPKGSLFLGDNVACTARYHVATRRWTFTDETY